MTFGKPWGFLAVLAVVLVALPSTGHSAKKYKEVEVADGGTVSGKVTFEGPLPEDAIERILITKNPDVCGTGEREIVWVDVVDGALRGSFGFIDKIAEGKKWAVPEGGAFLVDQKGCRFHPWAQVIKPGPLTIRNSDTGVLHNTIRNSTGRTHRRGCVSPLREPIFVFVSNRDTEFRPLKAFRKAARPS